MNNFDVSVVVNAHREGLLAAATLKSVEQAVVRATKAGLRVETICILDRPDQITKEIFADWVEPRDDAVMKSLNAGDLGVARNLGVSLAHGKWIAFLDADDLWSDNWLADAHRAAETEPRLAVWHPEVSLYFGARPHIFVHIDMDDPGFDLAYLAQTNLWTALCFARRSLLAEVPYRPTDFNRQVGYEDWGWHLETIARGACHKTVPGTVHAVRTKSSSLVGQTTAAQCLPYPTDLFRNILVDRERKGPKPSRKVGPAGVSIP